MEPDFVMNDEISRLTNEVKAARQRLTEALRRATPEPVEDWRLCRPDGSAVRLSELFAGKRDLIAWHNMGRECVYCTLWADGLRGFAEHLQDRAGFVLTSPNEPAVLREFAASRGWTFPCVSTAGTGFLKAMRMADPNDNSPWPGVSALHRGADGGIVRTGYAYFGPGDEFCPVWPAFDLLKDGHAEWKPKYSYQPEVARVGVQR